MLEVFPPDVDADTSSVTQGDSPAESAELSRRSLIFRSLAALFMAGCEGAPEPTPTSIDIPVDPTIPLPPEFERKTVKTTFGVPEGLDMPEADFMEKMRSFKMPLLTLFREAIEEIPGPAKTDGSALGDFFAAFLKDKLGPALQGLDPKIHAHVQAFLGAWSNNWVDLVHFLNQFFKPIDLYLSPLVPLKKGVLLDLNTLVSANERRVVGDREVPIYRLGKGMLPESFQFQLDIIGQAYRAPEHIVLYEESNRSLVEYYLKTWDSGTYDRFAGHSAEKLQAQSLDDFVYHELVHVWLRQQFPKVGDCEGETGEKPCVDYVMPVRFAVGRLPFVVGETFSSDDLHELMANGAQLARTANASPIPQLGLFSTQMPTYALAQKLGVLATIQTAPQTHPLRRQALEALSKKQWPSGQIAEMVATSPYALGNTHETGALMYRVGYDLIRRAERGDFAPVRQQ